MHWVRQSAVNHRVGYKAVALPVGVRLAREAVRKLVRRQAGSHKDTHWHQRATQLLYSSGVVLAGAHPGATDADSQRSGNTSASSPMSPMTSVPSGGVNRNVSAASLGLRRQFVNTITVR